MVIFLGSAVAAGAGETAAAKVGAGAVTGEEVL